MSPRRRSGGGRLTRALNLLAFLPLASRAPTYGRLLLTLALDPRVPLGRKALLGLAAAYVASPVDLIPERIPLIGVLDDVAVVVIAVDLFLDGLPPGVLDQTLAEVGMPREELDRDLARVRKTIPAPVRAAVGRLPEAIDGLVEAARSSGLERRLRDVVAGPARQTHPSAAVNGHNQLNLEDVPA
ncbi:hypothetical protein BH23CHL7_BH23CHL7_13190 [soil metagenome]